MALSKFPSAFNAVTDLLLSAANQARAIRDGSGDLRWSTIQNMVRTLGQLESAYEYAKIEAQKQLTAAQAYVSDMGGPATLAEFNTAMTDVISAKDVLLTGLDTLLGNMTGTDFYSQKSLNVGGYNVTLLESNDFVPTAQTATIRGSAGLVSLITELEALGA